MEDDPNLNRLLAEWLEAHGLGISEEAGWLIVASGGPRLAAWVVGERDHAPGYVVQVDVYVEVEPERLLIESFAGIGMDREGAVGDAMGNFALTTLHPLLAAFYGQEAGEQVTTEVWEIAGASWRVSIGPYGLRGRAGDALELPAATFTTLGALIKALPLDGSVHWVRLFYANVNAENSQAEVLLDNEPWEEAQQQLASLPWPRPESFYSVRLFFILQRGG